MEHQVVAPIKILIVDDHGIVREGLTALLNGQSTMKVIGTAADGMEAVVAAERLKPDVVIMDLVLPEISGIDATARIVAARPQTRVVILTAHDSSEHVFRALRAGARGYVLKDGASAELRHAVSVVFEGQRYLSPRITGLVVDAVLRDPPPHSPVDSLSAREREVLHLTVSGASSAEIGLKLSLSRKTVDTYRSRVMGKLGVTDLAALIRFAVAHALTPL
jgi:DNA-binding NarL/FixJ family response regulator